MADLHKLSTTDLRALEGPKVRETHIEITRELAKIRMDIYTAKNQHTGKIRGLRKTLARLLTIENEKARAAGPKVKVPKVATPKAPKAAAKPKVEKVVKRAEKPKDAKAAPKVATPKKAKPAK